MFQSKVRQQQAEFLGHSEYFFLLFLFCLLLVVLIFIILGHRYRRPEELLPWLSELFPLVQILAALLRLVQIRLQPPRHVLLSHLRSESPGIELTGETLRVNVKCV